MQLDFDGVFVRFSLHFCIVQCMEIQFNLKKNSKIIFASIYDILIKKNHTYYFSSVSCTCLGPSLEAAMCMWIQTKLHIK